MVFDPQIRVAGQAGTRATQRGFSVVDLMVSMAVMALLVAILLPSLVSANEMARRAKCASNIRQLGLGVQMYAYEHGEVVPPSTFNAMAMAGRDSSSQDTIYVRLDGHDFPGDRQLTGVMWDGLGHLASLNYADAPNVYYCPSHTGDHPFSKYRETWLQRTGTIADNYQYRISNPGQRLSSLKRNVTMIADGMRTQLDYNHRVGNNMLKADLSIQWYSDTTGLLFGLLPENDTAARAGSSVNRAWEALDNPHTEGDHQSTSQGGN